MGRGIKSSQKSNVKSAIIRGKRVLDILCRNIELLDGEIYSYWKFEDQIILVENKAKSLRGHLVTAFQLELLRRKACIQNVEF